jgi:hypothetical protein
MRARISGLWTSSTSGSLAKPVPQRASESFCFFLQKEALVLF